MLNGFNERVRANIIQYEDAMRRNPDRAAYIQPKIEALNLACRLLHNTIAEVAGV